MFHIVEHNHDLSLRLSEVLDDIGVNETTVMRWRKATLLRETMETNSIKCISRKILMYLFGSLSEGTTTLGLESDMDFLSCSKNIVVIQDYAEWQPGFINLLMIKDENTSPGYCHLQLIRSDIPLPYACVNEEHCVTVNSDKMLLKNTFFDLLSLFPGELKHGPAWIRNGSHVVRDMDCVVAFHCKSWPKEGRKWFDRGVNNWPTQEMKGFSEKTGCFVVAVGSKVSQDDSLEWRISTSLAERCLMFNLNITQIRCYILMKMILKTYLNLSGECHLSSFMCKSTLFYCIENTHPNLWREINLLRCLLHCLQRLYTSLVGGNCPHFIIPENNLMAGKFSVRVKKKLQEKLCHILQSNGHALLGIQVDDLGTRLQSKLNELHHPVQRPFLTKYEILIGISLNILVCSIMHIIQTHSSNSKMSSNGISQSIQQSLLQDLHRYATVYKNGNALEQTVCSLLVPPICSTLGTVIASLNLQTNDCVSSEAIDWLHAGLNSDVSSGRLKLASVLYSTGDMVRTENILRKIERRYDTRAVEPACGCYKFPNALKKLEFVEYTYLKDIVHLIRDNTASCVKFIPAEVRCMPHELQYEMFRSTQDELLHRNMDEDYWMAWAVVDSLPYLYFLQYKTYGQLLRYADQKQALKNLRLSIRNERNLGHRETALNLLGQCMEKENRIQEALQCYTSSLTIRGRNNVARVHICRLLAKLVNGAQLPNV